jgi:hypothetical protein
MKTKRGSALLLTTILLFVVLSMVVSLSFITVMEQKMSQKTKSSIGSFFYADSGVEWALNKIVYSNSSARINTIGLTFNADGSAQCPFGGCSVYFLKADGTTIKPAELATLTVDDIKAVRSVGSQGGTTQRAIEAAVAGTDCWCAPQIVKATTSTHNGAFGGYRAMNTFVQNDINCGSGFHVCDITEITRYYQLNPTGSLDGWAVGGQSIMLNNNGGDCVGWTSSNGDPLTGFVGNKWESTHPTKQACNNSYAVMCCK